MSAKYCARGNCPEIMCDRLILDSTRYICNSCYEELCRWQATWPETEVRRVASKIRDFMCSDPGDFEPQPLPPTDREAMDAEFKRLTGG